MKIKILKDIPGYKMGSILEISEGSLGVHTYRNTKTELVHYNYQYLIDEGFAEEVKDEIDVEDIRKHYKYIKAQGGNDWAEVSWSFNDKEEPEIEWFTAYRVVKAVIEKLNGDWTPKRVAADDLYGFCVKGEDEISLHSYALCRFSIIPYCKDRETVLKVIELCKPELEILFGVK